MAARQGERLMGWTALAHLQVHGFIGVSFHKGLVGVPPIPAMLPHVTFNLLNGLFLGAQPANVKGREVLGQGDFPLMGRGTDAGMISPHVSIPPTNWLLPLTILLGGSESLLGSSATRITCKNAPLSRLFGAGPSDEFDTAACMFPLLPFSYNFGCNDPPPFLVPLDFVIAPNTVGVSVTATDLLATAIDVAMAVMVELLGMAGGAVIKKLGAKRAAKVTSKKLAKATKAGKDAYQKALKDVDPKTALAEGLQKRRAQVQGTPLPPPRSVAKARRAGDEAFSKVIKEEFPSSVSDLGKPVKASLPWKSVKRLERAGAKVARKVVIDLVMGEIAGAAADGLNPKSETPPPPPQPSTGAAPLTAAEAETVANDPNIQAGEAILTEAGV